MFAVLTKEIKLKQYYGDSLEQVKKYKYLRSKITKYDCSTTKILSRLNQTKCTFKNKKNMFISGIIDIKLRKNLLKTYVWTVTLYENETWTIDKTK